MLVLKLLNLKKKKKVSFEIPMEPFNVFNKLKKKNHKIIQLINN